MLKRISLPLAVVRQADGRRKLLRPFSIEVRGWTIIVPEGFVTDYSSFPWLTRNIVRWDRVDVAGVVHDWLFYIGYYSLWETNLIWKEIAENGEHSANKLQGLLGWMGLTLGSWNVWRKYRKEERK